MVGENEMLWMHTDVRQMIRKPEIQVSVNRRIKKLLNCEQNASVIMEYEKILIEVV